ncbi:Ank1 [Symbiodinium natans]|uniref:Ank1 protein n=1 Tax=Symbiodinium natans TaxID=878477 RepID=A0A812STH1_9DINO|nr:Ank1 [Symbiodinium natans]
MCPEATQLVAAARILRFLLRWVTQRRALNGLPPLSAPWAPPPAATEMSAAAQRHSWRRIEIALANEDTCPFGITPLLLASTIGHLTAAQFLYVRGASPHVLGGQPPMLPVEAAARHNHLRIVELLLENGSVAGRSLHFAAAGGSTDVATFLLAKNCALAELGYIPLGNYLFFLCI